MAVLTVSKEENYEGYRIGAEVVLEQFNNLKVTVYFSSRSENGYTTTDYLADHYDTRTQAQTAIKMMRLQDDCKVLPIMPTMR